jgi:hypothetical protein
VQASRYSHQPDAFCWLACFSAEVELIDERYQIAEKQVALA